MKSLFSHKRLMSFLRFGKSEPGSTDNDDSCASSTASSPAPFTKRTANSRYNESITSSRKASSCNNSPMISRRPLPSVDTDPKISKAKLGNIENRNSGACLNPTGSGNLLAPTGINRNRSNSFTPRSVQARHISEVAKQHNQTAKGPTAAATQNLAKLYPSPNCKILTDTQVLLLRKSWRRNGLQRDDVAFGTLVFKYLFQIQPQIRGLFAFGSQRSANQLQHDDVLFRNHARIFATTIDHAVDAANNLADVVDQLQRDATYHSAFAGSDYGFTSSLWNDMGEAMGRALAEWTKSRGRTHGHSETNRAWRLLVSFIVETMQCAYEAETRAKKRRASYHFFPDEENNFRKDSGPTSGQNCEPNGSSGAAKCPSVQKTKLCHTVSASPPSSTSRRSPQPPSNLRINKRNEKLSSSYHDLYDVVTSSMAEGGQSSNGKRSSINAHSQTEVQIDPNLQADFPECLLSVPSRQGRRLSVPGQIG